MSDTIQLYDAQGRRLYLSSAERDAFLDAAAHADRPIRTLCSVLYYTGCRISEALALSPRRIDLHDQTIIFESLKKRRRGVYRAVPVPPSLLDTLDMVHGLREAHKRHHKALLDAELWPWSRITAWRQVKAVMRAAAIPDGPHQSPKGLRHGFAIHALSKGVPLNMVSKWMGHAKLETTAIYYNAVGEEQQTLAARMWTRQGHAPSVDEGTRATMPCEASRDSHPDRQPRRPCRAGTARAADVLVTLGRGGEFPLLLGPLGRLLFFGCQERFLLHFFFLCAFFGHGLRSSAYGCASDQYFIIPPCRTSCPQAERDKGIRAFSRLGYMLLSIIPNYTPNEDERGVQAMKNTSILFCTATERLFAALERGS